MDRDHYQEQLDAWRDDHVNASRFEAFRVTARLSGPVSISSPGLHLDGVLAYAVMREALGDELYELPDRVSPPFDMPLPLERKGLGETRWVWHCTVAHLEDHDGTSVAYWRKRYDETHHHAIEERKQVDTASGKYKSWNQPLRLDHARAATWEALGDPHLVQRLLEDYVTAIGKKRSQGYGQVRAWEIDTSPVACPLITEEAPFVFRRSIPHAPTVAESDTDPITLGVRAPYWHTENQDPAYPPGTEVDTWA